MAGFVALSVLASGKAGAQEAPLLAPDPGDDPGILREAVLGAWKARRGDWLAATWTRSWRPGDPFEDSRTGRFVCPAHAEFCGDDAVHFVEGEVLLDRLAGGEPERACEAVRDRFERRVGEAAVRAPVGAFGEFVVRADDEGLPPTPRADEPALGFEPGLRGVVTAGEVVDEPFGRDASRAAAPASAAKRRERMASRTDEHAVHERSREEADPAASSLEFDRELTGL